MNKKFSIFLITAFLLFTNVYAAHADNKENLKHDLNIINIKLNNLINNYLTNLVELIQKNI